LREALLPRLAGAAAPELSVPVNGDALIMAAKEPKKNKKPEPSRPLATKTHRKKVAAAKKSRRDATAKNADRFFAGWFERFGLKDYHAADWGRLAVLTFSLLTLLYYSFKAGGFFVIQRGYGELFILYLLTMVLLFRLQVIGRIHLYGWLEIGLFGAYSLWILLSVTWSLSPGDSLNEFNRAVLYLAGFTLFLLCLDRREWLRSIGHLFIAITLIVAVAALSYKVIPDVVFSPSSEFPTIETWFSTKIDVFMSNRLSYPLTYWNTVALLMLMASPLALRVLVDRKTSMIVRGMYSIAAFLFLTTLFFTFSRAGILLYAMVAGIYVLISSSRLRAILQTGMTVFWVGAIALISWRFLPAMVESAPEVGLRVSEGHRLGWLLILTLPLIVAAQWVVVGLDRRVTVSQGLARKIGYSLAAASIVVVLAGGAFAVSRIDSPVDWLSAQWRAVTETKSAGTFESAEDRLLSLQSERFKEYGVSVQWFSEYPLKGSGAGTWELVWLKYRPAYVGEDGNTQVIKVKDGHSWFFESLSELGIVGAVLLLSFVALFFTVSIRDLRFLKGPDREIYGPLFAACAIFLVHSMIDWDWEMPVVALPFFMFAGALLKYGMIVRAEDAAVGGPYEQALEKDDVRSRRLVSRWPLLVGALCLAAMALTVFSVIGASKTRNATKALNQARVQNQQQNTAQAKALLAEVEDSARSAHRYYPLDAEPLMQISIVLQSKGDLDEALRILEEARDLEPNNFTVYQRLAEVYLVKGETQNAVEAIVLARELNPLDSGNTGILEQQIIEAAREEQ
jgi:hypothetical protein